jgi:carboxypeptidase C (cathepsin A)
MRFSEEYRGQAFTPYTVRGQVAGQVKNAGGFSYLRVYAAGHLVPAYTIGSLDVGEAALQMFEQVMGLGPLVGT